MTLPDTNVFIYAANRDARPHRVAQSWLASAAGGHEQMGLAWTALLGFLRLSTKPGLFPKPLTLDQAFEFVQRLLAAPGAQVLLPGHDHALTLRRLLAACGTGGNLVPDAHLAALAIEQGAELVTFDRDFGRFPGLRWKLLE